MSELSKRVLFAVPAAILFLYLTWLGGWYFNAMIILIGLLIQKEVVSLLTDAGNPPDLFVPYSIGLWVMLFPHLPFAIEIGLAIVLIFLFMQVFNHSPQSISHLSTTFFAALYAPLGLLCLMLIRDMGSPNQGFVLTLAVILMVWGSDIFAYFGGKMFGKHKLAPAISPNKTWEGFISGYIGCAIGLFIALFAGALSAPVTFLQAMALVFLVGTFGPIGDLLESKIKRKANCKDSSNLLPGHGGFFDRFDALLTAAPAAWLYLSVLQETGYAAF